MMLVDGDTLCKTRNKSGSDNEQAPVFHTLGLCIKAGDAHVHHVVHSQPGFSSLYKQPSLNATLRPADLSQVEWKVRHLQLSNLQASCLVVDMLSSIGA